MKNPLAVGLGCGSIDTLIMKNTYILRDTFNNCTISRHRSLEAAVKAGRSHDRSVKRNNGQNSYIPTVILLDGKPVDFDEIISVKMALDFAR